MAKRSFGWTICLVMFFPLQAYGQTMYGPYPLAHTYSIVAYDPETGEMGVAVQSHWFSVGTIVSWGEAGVGVVATQSFVNPAFGPEGLKLMKRGFTPREAVDTMLASDEGREVRQLALLDSKGRVAVHTGSNCIPEAGHYAGEYYSVQANLMLNNTVWRAMAEAFENASGPLAERLIIALKAAEGEGGDIRGRQSAALLVVRGDPTGNLWEDRLVDIRIADHPEPLEELERILKVHRAYEHMNRGDLAIERGDHNLAMEEYGRAEMMFPDNLEMKYWHAVSLVNTGKLEQALPLFREVFAGNRHWKILTPRLVDVGLLNVTAVELNRITSVH